MSVRPDVVCWYEGMQLLPQHFQLQGLRAEALAAHLAQAGNPWYWGVTQLELDPAELVAGTLRILRLEATMPDGLALGIRDGEGPRVELKIAEAVANAPDACVTVYLALDRLWRGNKLLGLNGRMHSVKDQAFPNLVTGLDDELVELWKPCPRLVTEADKGDAVCLPLLRVQKKDGGFECVGDYVAPTPRILPESPLGKRVARLCADVREAGKALANQLRPEQMASDPLRATHAFRQSAALWARLPEVEGALKSRIASPQKLHGLLLGMAGSWSVLSANHSVPAFAPLDFLALYQGFDEVLDWLEQCLSLLRVGYRSLPFEKTANGFGIQLPTFEAGATLVIGLRMRAGSLEQDASLWLAQTTIGALEHVDEMIRQRARGLVPVPMAREAQGVFAAGEQTYLFEIDTASPSFVATKPLRIVAPASSELAGPWQIVLLVPDNQ